MNTRFSNAPSHRRPRLRALVLLVGSIGMLAVAGAVPASASGGVSAQSDDATLTWSVRPSPTEDEPDRPNFGYDIEPSATVTDSIRVRNYTDEPLTLDLYASDALATSSGALDLLPAGEESTDVGAWIELEESKLTVPAQDIVDVPFTLTVPADAEPGDHTGGIVTSYQTPGVDEQGEPVVLDRRLGSRVHVRVGGELQPLLEISDIDVSYSGTLNPFGTGTLHVSYTVTNAGNVRLGAEQVVSTSGLGLGRAVDGEPMGELLPANSLTFDIDIDGVWPTVRTTAKIELTPIPIRDGDVFDPATPAAVGSASTWAMPWTLLGLLLIAVAAPLLISRQRRRRRRREAQLVDQAVRDALAEQNGATSVDPTTDEDAAETSEHEGGHTVRTGGSKTHSPG